MYIAKESDGEFEIKCTLSHTGIKSAVVVLVDFEISFA